jgi:hypothetical protein
VRPAVLALVTLGSRTSAGRSALTRDTASRTSVTASVAFFSRMNSTVMPTSPSRTSVCRCFTPCRVAMESSSLRATSVSSCAGAAPSSVAVTVTIGSSTSGKSCTAVARKASRPASVTSRNVRTTATGLRMAVVEKFMVVA